MCVGGGGGRRKDGFKRRLSQILSNRAQELCESRGGRPGLPSLTNLQFLWTLKQHFNQPNLIERCQKVLVFSASEKKRKKQGKI